MGGKDQTHWFRCEVEIRQWKDDKVALFFTPSWPYGGLSGSETLAYIDGAAARGLDVNHHEIHVLQSGKTGVKFRLPSRPLAASRMYSAASQLLW